MKKYFYITATEAGTVFSTAIQARSLMDAQILFARKYKFATLISIEA